MTPSSSALITTEVPILGMTCRTCELRIGRHLMRIRGVEEVSVSARRGRAVIQSSREIPYRSLEKAIEAAGYEIGATPWLSRDRGVWLTAAAGLAVVAIAAVAAELLGVSRLSAGAGELSSGGVLVSLLLGLAAGVSTCMALVGGLVLAVSAAHRAARPGARSGAAALRPAVVFLAGRVVGYASLGALLGAIGASVTMPPVVTAGLMIAVAIVMTILGARLTEVSPRIAGWSPTLPLGLARSLGLAGGSGSGSATSAAGYSDGRAAVLGAATFFLPCGFTQAVQVFALSTGSPLYGAALLGSFALGTVPGLLALAGLPAVVPSGLRPTLLRLVGVVVIGFGLLNANAGLQLAGIGLPDLGATAATGTLTSTIATDGSSQALLTHQDADGYSPRNVTIAAGIPTTWTIQSSTTSSCAATLVIPAWDTGRQLQLGANTISLPALQPGVIRYSCAMGMYTGTITVVDRPTGQATTQRGG